MAKRSVKILKHLPKGYEMYDVARSAKQARSLSRAYEVAVYSPKIIRTPKFKQFPYHIAVLKKPRFYLRSLYRMRKVRG